MSSAQKSNLLWWVIPDVLAGMPMPFVDLERRMARGGALTAFNDELPVLHSSGVRAVVSLLNIPSDAPVYESAGFVCLCQTVARQRWNRRQSSFGSSRSSEQRIDQSQFTVKPAWAERVQCWRPI
jgi:hypothetical protein